MKKNLQNAMAKNFQKMVNEQPTQEVSNKKSVNAAPKKENPKPTVVKEEKKEPVSPVINEPEEVEEIAPVIEETQVLTPQPAVTPTINTVPVQQPVPIQQQPIPEPVIQPIVPPVTPMQPQNIPVQQAAPVYYQTPIMPQQVQEMQYNPPVQPQINEMTHNTPKSSMKKSIPLVPEEKSSGVLHIRLGELRSYVDFMTQSGKISYQQYISNLIEQDYEKNKDLYMKYKSFMDQLNM